MTAVTAKRYRMSRTQVKAALKAERRRKRLAKIKAMKSRAAELSTEGLSLWSDPRKDFDGFFRAKGYEILRLLESFTKKVK